MVVAQAGDGGGGTRLREKQQDDDEPVSVAANTSLEKADSLQSGNSGGSGSGGSSGPSQSVESPDRLLGREVGSANLQISLDENGRAQETLSGMGSGGANSTQGVTTDDTTTVTTVTADETIADVETTEQQVENATDGRAYGDPNETENIGTGDAVTSNGSGGAGGSPSELLAGLPVDGLVVTALALVGVAMVAGGGDGG